MPDRETKRPPQSAEPFPIEQESSFTPERLAFLQTRLQRLLADLRLLETAVSPSLEPAFTPRDGFQEDRDAR